jgi:hypothetical protein
MHKDVGDYVQHELKHAQECAIDLLRKVSGLIGLEK